MNTRRIALLSLVITLFLCFILATFLFSIMLSAEAEEEAVFAGSGTRLDPYIIDTPYDLLSLMDILHLESVEGISEQYSHYSSAAYLQTSDIDMSKMGEWRALCNYAEYPFVGQYNGNGFSVTGMQSTEFSTGEAVGFFGVLGPYSVVRSLSLTHTVSFKGTYDGLGCDLTEGVEDTSLGNVFSIGLIAGYGYENSMIDRCTANGSIYIELSPTETSIETSVYCGGIIGGTRGTVKNCVAVLGDNSLTTATAIETLTAEGQGIVSKSPDISTVITGGLSGILYGTIENCNAYGSALFVEGSHIFHVTGGAIGSVYAVSTVSSVFSMFRYVKANTSGLSVGNLFSDNVERLYYDEENADYDFESAEDNPNGNGMTTASIPVAKLRGYGYDASSFDPNNYDSLFLRCIYLGDSIWIGENTTLGITGATVYVDYVNNWIKEAAREDYIIWASDAYGFPIMSEATTECNHLFDCFYNEKIFYRQCYLCWSIAESDLAVIATLSETESSYSYNGSAVEPFTIATELDDYKVGVVYSDNIYPGTAKAELYVNGAFVGQEQFIISTYELIESEFSLSEYSVEYLCQPEVIFKSDVMTLEEGVDYTVTHEGSGLGTYYAIVTGIGNCSGVLRIAYTVIHTHAPDEYHSSDLEAHWFECVLKDVFDCNEKLYSDSHSDEDEDNICDICQTRLVSTQSIPEKINETNKTIEEIFNGESENETMNEYLSRLPEEKREEIAAQTQAALSKTLGDYQEGSVGEEDLATMVNTISAIAETAVEVSAGKENKLTELVEQEQNISQHIPLIDSIDTFYEKQYQALLAFSFDRSPQEFKEVAAFSETVANNMTNMTMRVRSCSGGESVLLLVNSYVTEVSQKTFRDYNQEEADNEFVAAAYQAILLYLQEQTLYAAELEFEKAVSSGSYTGTKLTELESAYNEQVALIKDIEAFDDIVLEVMREKYIMVLDYRIEQGIITEEAYDSYIVTALDSETFRPKYDEIFRSWALNQGTEEVTLEDMTTALQSDYAPTVTKLHINEHMEAGEYGMIFGLLAAAIAVLAVLSIIHAKEAKNAEKA